jgi:hypothetical protein
VNFAEHPFHDVRGIGPKKSTDIACTLGAQAHRRGIWLARPRQMGESQLAELRNMRELLEEARVLTRNLAYHRRARLEAVLG